MPDVGDGEDSHERDGQEWFESIAGREQPLPLLEQGLTKIATRIYFTGSMNVSLGKLSHWIKDQVKHGDYETDSELVREAVRRMKDSQPAEPAALQRLMDEAESSGFKKFSRQDWNHLRRLARTGQAK